MHQVRYIYDGLAAMQNFIQLMNYKISHEMDNFSIRSRVDKFKPKKAFFWQERNDWLLDEDSLVIFERPY